MTTWTTRLPASAVLYGPRPPPHRQARPAPRQGRAAGQARPDRRRRGLAAGHRQLLRRRRSRHAGTPADALWHGSFGTAPGRLVLVREPGSARPCDLGSSPSTPPPPPRRSSNATPGGGPSSRRTRPASSSWASGTRATGSPPRSSATVPFGFLVQSLLICWYATATPTTPPMSTGAACYARGTPPRPNPAPPTCSPGSAASSSPPGFLSYGQARPHPAKSPATPGPATPSRHNSETRGGYRLHNCR